MKDQNNIERFRYRRRERLNKRKGAEIQRIDSVEEFYKRRNERRKKRNLSPINYPKDIDIRRDLWYNKDAERFDIEFKEEDHPRDESGKFSNKSSGSAKKQEVQTTKTNRSASYQRYYDSASEKVKALFPKDQKHSVGINYKGQEVPLKYQSQEAQEIFNRVSKQDNYTVEELRGSETVKMLDSISDKCTEILGETCMDNSEERRALRREIKKKFMGLGSARLNSKGKTEAFDGPVKHEFKAVIYTGLPAVGKSSVVDPLSASEGMFVFDNDTIKSMIPEFEATGGAAASAVHRESSAIQWECFEEFLEGGSRNGDNIAYPMIGADFEGLMSDIRCLQDSGYTVEVRCLEASPDLSASRSIARAIEEGRIINSRFTLGYGDAPSRTYRQLEEYDKKHGTKLAAGIKQAG